MLCRKVEQGSLSSCKAKPVQAGGKAMKYEAILVDREAPVATITMNRPERRNALSVDMMNELIDAFKTLGRDTEVRAIILAANGPAFSAGHDLRELVGG